jgi:hypothetical protein
VFPSELEDLELGSYLLKILHLSSQWIFWWGQGAPL